MSTKLYINSNCEPEHNDGTKLSDWEKKQVYAALANKGLTDESDWCKKKGCQNPIYGDFNKLKTTADNKIVPVVIKW